MMKRAGVPRATHKRLPTNSAGTGRRGLCNDLVRAICHHAYRLDWGRLLTIRFWRSTSGKLPFASDPD